MTSARRAIPSSINVDNVLWKGSTVDVHAHGKLEHDRRDYTVLQLTAQNDSPDVINAGDVDQHLQADLRHEHQLCGDACRRRPVGCTRTNRPRKWSSAATGSSTPAMSDPDVPDGERALGDVENSIVSALNRGIATNLHAEPRPQRNCAGQLGRLSADDRRPTVATDTGSTLTADTYYYVVTAVNACGQTTPSLEVSATVTVTTKRHAELGQRPNAVPAILYNIYRGTSPYDLTLLHRSTAVTTYSDDGSRHKAEHPRQSVLCPRDHVELVRRLSCSPTVRSTRSTASASTAWPTDSPTPTRAASRPMSVSP